MDALSLDLPPPFLLSESLTAYCVCREGVFRIFAEQLAVAQRGSEEKARLRGWG